ncbi:MAG: filamentous hemagglutinin N-terminal domain-containing protein [Nitrospira sp.]|nr:filamentous hemagglutinin N-terminal domain-containing protein [Nitrospira sp.]
MGGKTQYDITGGTRTGANLFHSFGNFDVPGNTIANFRNDSLLQTDNILGRVTGNHISDIFGTIKTTDFGNAHLFLMNPAGFLFGPNASLNVSGAVTFTSADYLKFEDGRRFSAAPNPVTDVLLTAYPVASFGFLGSHPGAITVQGSQLEVRDGTGISLVGGNITIESTVENGAVHPARLFAPNGKIQLATTASPGVFPVKMNAVTLAPSQLQTNINGTSLTSFGALALAPNSRVNVSDMNSVSIRGGQFVLSVNDATLSTTQDPDTLNSISVTPTSLLLSANAGSLPGADIKITIATLQMDHAQIISRTTGAGSAGSIEIVAQAAIDIHTSAISSASEGQAADAGSGGHIILQAPSVEIVDGTLSSQTVGPGDAGNISLRANTLTLSSVDPRDLKSTKITATTSGPGRGGDISILGIAGPGSRAHDVTLSGLGSLRSETLNGDETGTGTAGNIIIDAIRLSLREQALITTASRDSDPSFTNSGNAGNITLNATESVHVSHGFVTSDVAEASTGNGGHIIITTPNLIIGEGGYISTSTTSTGNAGTVTINSNSVTLADGGQLRSSSSLEDFMPPPTGAGGSVVVRGVPGQGSQANLITISGKDRSGAPSGVFTDTHGIGPGGNITLNAKQVRLDSGASITANSTGEARAGNITITATDGLTMMENSSITTLVPQGSTGSNAGGGNIKITTSPSATIHLQNSLISASVGDGRGEGGNISIDPQLIILQNSKILAQADEGRGGRITIVAGLFLPDANSIVTADSGSGVNGTVTIQSPTSNLSGTIGQLVSKTSPPQVLVHSRCAALLGGHESTFVLTGRGTVPSEPGGWLLSPFAIAASESDGNTISSTEPYAKEHRLIRKSPFLSLRQIAPSGFLTRAFATNWLSSCRS